MGSTPQLEESQSPSARLEYYLIMKIFLKIETKEEKRKKNIQRNGV